MLKITGFLGGARELMWYVVILVVDLRKSDISITIFRAISSEKDCYEIKNKKKKERKKVEEDGEVTWQMKEPSDLLIQALPHGTILRLTMEIRPFWKIFTR